MWVVCGGMPWCLSHCVCLSRIGGRDRAYVARLCRPSGGGEDPRRARGRSEYSGKSKPLPPPTTCMHVHVHVCMCIRDISCVSVKGIVDMYVQ